MTNSTLKIRSGATEILPGAVITYNNQTKTVEEWKADAANNLEPVFSWSNWNGPWPNSCFVAAGEDCTPSYTGLKQYVGLYDESHWKYKTSGVENVDFTRDEHVKVQYLSGVEQVPAMAWNVKTGNSFFGPGAFFEEGKAYYGSEKLGTFYNETEMAAMEQGFSITTKGGPIELPYIFGCTAFSNQFGYIYWKKGDEKKPGFNPLALPHFILIEDARPSQNILSATKAADGTVTTTAITGSTFQHDCWASLVTQDIMYTGTTYRVMYFGDDYKNTTGAYDWGEDYEIVFFISSLANSEDETLLKTTHNPHGSYSSFNYSIPAYNEILGHHYQQPGKYPEKKDMGMVKCITWTQDGKTYMGFGDNSGDQDLNDIVFLVSGNFEDTGNSFKVKSVKWHLNYEGKHHDGTNGTVKDDDLLTEYSLQVKDDVTYSKPTADPSNGTKSFKGWALTPTISSESEILTDAQLTDVAVTNDETICYYAIWDDTPIGGDDPVIVKWHKNYDGKHHDGTNSTTLDDDLQGSAQSVAKGSNPTKPSDPTAPAGKQFLGWAETPGATSPLSDADLAAITINEDKCFYAVYGTLPPVDSDPEWISWIFACEDLGGSFDYDFNDVVWEVRYSSDTKTLQARLLAAGGTLPFTLKYGSTDIVTKADAFGNTSTVFIQPNPTRWYEVGTVESWSASNPADREKFQVVVDQTSYEGDSSASSSIISTSSENGNKTPQVIVLPYQWCWPTEGTNICSAYTEFTEWVSDALWSSWSSHKQEGKTVNR